MNKTKPMTPNQHEHYREGLEQGRRDALKEVEKNLHILVKVSEDGKKLGALTALSIVRAMVMIDDELFEKQLQREQEELKCGPG